MKKNSRTSGNSSLTQEIGLVIMAFVCVVALFGCSGDETNVYDVKPSTVGSLNVNTNPASATVVVTGPNSFTQSFTGNKLLTDMAPGQYWAKSTSIGFADDAGGINVVAGQTSNISLVLKPTAIISDAPRAVFRDDKDNLIPLASPDSGQFVFYAWLKDVPAGILPANLTGNIVSDPGKPLLDEQYESAPSLTQNLVCAWVGFKDSKGVIQPVIGADVRWEIDQSWSGRVGSMQFGTSDDNRLAIMYGVFDDQANTRTNNARLEAERFPFAVNDYPLYNQTGIGTPYIDGLTWVTLFSPDPLAAGRIVAVATINGEEIGKQILYKNFAPKPELVITKSVNVAVVNMVNGTASVTWSVTAENIGSGNATKVDLRDILASGAGENYSLVSLPEGSTPVGDGFTNSFPLASKAKKTLTFVATVTAAGTYCNEAQILSYGADSMTWTPADRKAQACFTALESNVSIVKDFVADDNTTSMGKSRTVAVNEPAKLRVQVINKGTGSATGIQINDTLTSGNLATYRLISVSSGTPNAAGGFGIAIGDLASGATKTLIFSVSASADGEYCDTAEVKAASGSIGISSDRACLIVATPNLTITKTDAPESVLPGATYTSTIVVNNSGNATAKDVIISDQLGLNPIGSVLAIYVSSNLNGMGGTLADNVVTANKADIPAGGSMTFTVVSRIPLGAISGTYCDTATFKSGNAGTKQASACVKVPAFSAIQTQLIDLNDPVAIGSNVTYFSVIYVEALSNEGVNRNKLTFSFGLASPTTLGIPGVFRMTSTKIYLDTKPVRDPITGLVLSDTSNPTAVLLTAGTDYTTNDGTAGLQTINMTPGVVLQPDTALYVVHLVMVPSGTPTNKLYTTSYIWDSTGLVNPANTYQASSSEPTIVLP